MSQYHKIFLIADPSMRRTPAFERAVWLARASGAALHIALFDRNALINVAALVDKSGSAQATKLWMDQRMAWLNGEAAELSKHGIVVTTDVVWTRPAPDEILLKVADYEPDLVVKDVAYETGIRRVLFTPFDWQLLRLCPVPLLLVNTLAHAVPQRIVASVDASSDTPANAALNEGIIRQALALSIQCDAELHLVYAFAGINGLLDPQGAGLGAIGELRRAVLPVHQRNFDALAAAHSVPADRRHFLHGPAAETIAEFIRTDSSDVVVIGSARHSMIDRLLLGTTAEAILEQVPCNVLAVKS